ncbi:uncharacterized protein LOC134199093 [Bombyx mori]|uniref:uncharacterized protein LOC134199093 n=1 Tax=Bombyx mori TaxID=7091 RepID=UPI002ED613DA
MAIAVSRTTNDETVGLRKTVDLLHARLAQISAENDRLRQENGQMKVDMAEMRTLVNDLVEKQCNSAPASTPLETEEANEAEELRRRLLIQECYADDTLVVAPGRDYRESARLACAGVAHVVTRIRRLGLEVALDKTQALLFHGPGRAPPVGAHLVIGGVRVGVGVTGLRYLGLELDSRWNFRAHFEKLGPRLMATAGSLSRLLPNVGGPDQVAPSVSGGRSA